MDLLEIKLDTLSVDRLKMTELRDSLVRSQGGPGAPAVRDPHAAAMLSKLTDPQISVIFREWEGASLFPFRPVPEFMSALASVVDTPESTSTTLAVDGSPPTVTMHALDLMKLVIQRECLRRFGVVGRELCGIRAESTAQLIQAASLAQLGAALTRYQGPSIYPLAEGRGLITVLASALGMPVHEDALRIARATLRTAA